MLANSTAQPIQLTVVAASPAQPPSANGLATGRMVWVIGPDDTLQASTSTAVPAMATTATTRQRRERTPPVRQQQQRQGDGEQEADRPQAVPGQGGQPGRRRQRAAGLEQLVDPRVPGDVHRPDEAGGGVQPADRVLGPAQGQDQPDGGEQQPDGALEGAVDQHVGGHRPGHQERDHQPAGQAAECGQPQRPGEQRPALGAHGVNGTGSAVRERYDPASRAAWLT